MRVNLETKFDIGDTVWVYRYIMNFQTLQGNWGIEEREISGIFIAYEEDLPVDVTYTLDGVMNFEGENQFSDDPGSLAQECIFATKEEAEEYAKGMMS